MPANVLAQLARKYRKLYPSLKFRIVMAKLDGAFATTHFRQEDGTFVITFQRGMCQHLKAFLLSHELSHCCSWNMDSEEHGDGFWSAYRKNYRVYEDFVSG